MNVPFLVLWCWLIAGLVSCAAVAPWFSRRFFTAWIPASHPASALVGSLLVLVLYLFAWPAYVWLWLRVPHAPKVPHGSDPDTSDRSGSSPT